MWNSAFNSTIINFLVVGFNQNLLNPVSDCKCQRLSFQVLELELGCNCYTRLKWRFSLTPRLVTKVLLFLLDIEHLYTWSSLWIGHLYFMRSVAMLVVKNEHHKQHVSWWDKSVCLKNQTPFQVQQCTQLGWPTWLLQEKEKESSLWA